MQSHRTGRPSRTDLASLRSVSAGVNSIVRESRAAAVCVAPCMEDSCKMPGVQAFKIRRAGKQDVELVARYSIACGEVSGLWSLDYL